MSGVEWYGGPRPAVIQTRRLAGHIVTGADARFIAVMLIAAGVLLWNAHSHGGLVRALGAVTPEQVSAEIAAHPGPQGPPGPRGPAGAHADVAPPPAVPVVRLVAETTASYDKSGPIERSAAYPVCSLAKVALRRDAKNHDGACQLKRSAEHGGRWEVIVNDASCSVTCFGLHTSK